MNICLMTSEYPSPFSGGVQRVTNQLYEVFKNRGHQVYVISKDSPLLESSESENHHILSPLKNNKESACQFISAFFNEHQIEYVINNSHHTSIFDLLCEVEKSHQFTLLTCIHSDPDCLLKGLRDQWDSKKSFRDLGWWLTLPYQGLVYGVRYFKRKKHLKWLYRKKYKESDRIVLLSNLFIPAFKRYLPTSNGDKICAIANIIDLASQNHPVPKERIILWIGRMEMEAKRPDRMVEIWERLYRLHPDWHLYMIGDGSLRQPLINHCELKRIKNIHFIGRTNPIPYYKRASILCMTSTYEGFGLVLAEAQSYGVIPFAYDSYAAVHDIIEDGVTGHLISPFSIRKYADKLSELISNPELLSKERNNISSRKPYTYFSPAIIAEKWEAILKECSHESIG